jgi:uncharacterized protein (TIGR00369 family)
VSDILDSQRSLNMSTTELDGAELMREFLPHSPLVGHLGIRLVDLGDGEAVLQLPYRDELATIARIVHGGAIATLADTAAMVASWAGATIPETLQGSTVGLSITYLAPADEASLTAIARVVRRGRRLVTVQVDVRTYEDLHVATALVTYQLG